MRKKLLIAIALLLLVLCGLVAYDELASTHGLRVGMTPDEVYDVLGDDIQFRQVACKDDRYEGAEEYAFFPEPDWQGRQDEIHVFFKNWILVGWKVKEKPRTTPPWARAVLKRFGW